MRILITGGAGFVGSHAAEFYAKKGNQVAVFDNLSRMLLLKKDVKNATYNYNYLKKYKDIRFIKGDIRNETEIQSAAKDVDAIIHTAAQTAVTTSLIDPKIDFALNAQGTFNVLEAARRAKSNPILVYCSTNKVYGDNVNKIKVKEEGKRYKFERKHESGIPETYPIDLCGHTPYGCSKTAGDIYTQDYVYTYGLKTGIFRMSCIYGERQFGFEDQGWVAWFTIATITNRPITIYGNGKQVRDILYVEDLIKAFDTFIKRKNQHNGEAFNIGGGPENTISLLELLDVLKELTGKRSRIKYGKWRFSDQKVYVSDISKAKTKLGWTPAIKPKQGIKKLVHWVNSNKDLFI
ncbi:MAG: GDP-mannose 4,6-dehydratase [Candidatus Bathyarchaeota archaeon]